VEQGGVDSREGLWDKAKESLEFDSYEVQAIAEFGLEGPDERFIEQCIQTLFNEERLELQEGKPVLTPAGRIYLHHRIR